MSNPFQTLRDQLPVDFRHGSVEDRVDDLFDKARINADDTVFVEKARPIAEWDAVAMASVVDLLSFSTDAAVNRWFAERGIRA